MLPHPVLIFPSDWLLQYLHVRTNPHDFLNKYKVHENGVAMLFTLQKLSMQFFCILNQDTKLDFIYIHDNVSLPLSVFQQIAVRRYCRSLLVSGLPLTLPSHVQPPRL